MINTFKNQHNPMKEFAKNRTILSRHGIAYKNTGVSALRISTFGENSYKIQFREFEIFMPGFEEISGQRFHEKRVKNLKSF